jgi:DNA-binding IclR family transcriptional regulator
VSIVPTDRRDTPERPEPTQTLVKGLRVLETVAAHSEGVTLAQLSRSLPYPKSTTYRLAATLERLGYLVRLRHEERYRVGPSAVRMAGAALQVLPLAELARPHLESLAAVTGESSHVAILDGDEIVYVALAQGAHRVRPVTWIGMRLAAHATASGKAILAFAPEATLRSILSRGLVARTPDTITDEARFLAALAEARQRGYAVDDGEESPEVRCVAAPVFGLGGVVAGAIGVSAPSSRLSRDRFAVLGSLVSATASALSSALGHSPSQETDHGVGTSASSGKRHRGRLDV